MSRITDETLKELLKPVFAHLKEKTGVEWKVRESKQGFALAPIQGRIIIQCKTAKSTSWWGPDKTWVDKPQKAKTYATSGAAGSALAHICVDCDGVKQIYGDSSDWDSWEKARAWHRQFSTMPMPEPTDLQRLAEVVQ